MAAACLGTHGSGRLPHTEHPLCSCGEHQRSRAEPAAPTVCSQRAWGRPGPCVRMLPGVRKNGGLVPLCGAPAGQELWWGAPCGCSMMRAAVPAQDGVSPTGLIGTSTAAQHPPELGAVLARPWVPPLCLQPSHSHQAGGVQELGLPQPRLEQEIQL